MYFSKKAKKALALVSVLALGISAVPAMDADAAASAKLNKTKVTIGVKGKVTLKVTGKGIKKVTWKTSKSKVAAVKKKNSKSAVVTGKKKGKAIVTANVRLSNGKKKNLKCTVKVEKKAVKQTNAPVVTGTPANAPTNAPASSTPAPTQTAAQPTEPSKTQAPDSNEPTQVPVLDENNLAVAEYPTIFSDVPDCDFIRVGGTYYMVSTTMNLCPGVPIMKSTDLVNWQICNYVYDALPDLDRNNLENGQQMYSNGSWAAAIRYNEETKLFYVIFNVNGGGFFCYTTDDVEHGEWTGYHIDASFHDPALLFDDGNMYVIYAGATIQQLELEDGAPGELGEIKKVGKSKELVKKSADWGLWEGAHAYHIGDYYYIMIIASPSSGWFRTETCYRSKKLMDSEQSDWEEQIIFQGSTYEYGTGIAQGGIVDTIYGDWYGILFQDHDAIGRIPSILEVNWDYTDDDGNNYKDWPMMGYRNENNDFVACQSTKDKVTKPLTIRLNKSTEKNYIVDDDDFTYNAGDKLKLVWQWNHNPDNNNWSVTENPGYYRIKTGKTCNNVWFARNSLTQRTVGPEFTSETAIVTDGMKPGDYAGLVAVGSDYGMIGVKCDDDGKRYIFQGSGSANNARPADTTKITENAVADEITGETAVYLKVEYKFNTGSVRADKANFYYSLDGNNWNKLGAELSMSFNTSTTFMGARSWLSYYATQEAGGHVDFDYYKAY